MSTGVVRNISKNQVMQEDMALGVGEITQTRNGRTVTGSRIDIPVAVYSVAEIQAYSPQVSTRLMLEVAPDEYVYYIYRADETDGVPSSVAEGVWVPQNLKSSITLVTHSDTTLDVDGTDNNKFFTVDNEAGCIVTVGRSEADIGYGVVPMVPSLIFVRSDSLFPVSIVGATDVTVSTAALPTLYGKDSVAALVSVAVDKWILLGDLEV